MLNILLAWVFQWALLSGLGWLCYARLLRLASPDGWTATDLFRSFWIGFGVLAAAAQFYSLAFPLNGIFLGLATLLAAPGLWLLAQAVRTRALPTTLRTRWVWMLFGVLLAAVALRTAAGVSTLSWSGAYDSDLYHFNAVRWAKEYPAVPGLANLHSPLGLSSTYLLYAAVLDHGPWYRQSAWVVPGVFVVMLAAQVLWTLLCAPRAARAAKYFCGLQLPFVLLLVTQCWPSLYYDRPAVVFMTVALWELLQGPAAAPAPRERLASLCTLLALAGVSVSIKPVGFAAAVLLGGWGLWQAWRLPERAAVLKVALLPAALAVGLLARNAVLSGWLLYPAPRGALPVDWAVPADPPPGVAADAATSIRNAYAVFQAWARQPGPDHVRVLQGGRWSWWPGWWARNRNAVEIQALAGGALLLLLGLLRRRRRPRDGALGLALGVVGATLLFWFWMAPDLRFGEGYFWLWFALAGAFCLTTWAESPRVWGTAGLLAAAALCVVPIAWAWPAQVTAWHIGQACEANLHKVELRNGQQPPLVVWVPDGDDRAGDAPLPNTPYPRDNLCWRVPGSLRHGFYLARPGGWPGEVKKSTTAEKSAQR